MMIRSLLLLLPLALWTYAFISPRFTGKDISASFLGFVWAFHASLLLNILFMQQGFWKASIDDTLFYGVALDWVIAQAIIMGAIVPLFFSKFILRFLPRFNRLSQSLLTLALVVFMYDAAGMPLTALSSIPVILSVIIFCALPAQLLAHWTAQETHIKSRSTLQSLAWACLLLWLLPSTLFYLTDESWNTLLQRDLWFTGLYLLPLIIPAVLLIGALYQFAIEGEGTAFPYDPPRKLVTGGVYQYLSNPMQLGICLMMGWWGFVLGSLWVAITAPIAFILFLVFKDVCNGSCAIGKGDPAWEAYQKRVRKWVPRFRS